MLTYGMTTFFCLQHDYLETVKDFCARGFRLLDQDEYKKFFDELTLFGFQDHIVCCVITDGAYPDLWIPGWMINVAKAYQPVGNDNVTSFGLVSAIQTLSAQLQDPELKRSLRTDYAFGRGEAVKQSLIVLCKERIERER